MQGLGRWAAPGVEVDGFLSFVGVENQVQIPVGKDELPAQEGVGPVPRDALEALDEGLVDEGDAELS